jgi:hypothetical protein
MPDGENGETWIVGEDEGKGMIFWDWTGNEGKNDTWVGLGCMGKAPFWSRIWAGYLR